MQRLLKILLTAALLCFVTISLAARLCSEPISQLHATNYVNDFAHVLNDQTAAELNDSCQQLDQKADAQISLVTVNSTDGQDVFDYSVALYQAWGIGAKSTKRGVLILLAVKDRKYWTTVGYGLEPILPDGKVGGFGREAIPLLKRGDYDGAARLMTMRVAEVIAQDSGIQLTGEETVPPTARPSPQMSLRSVILFVIVIIMVLATPLRRVLFWWLLFNSGSGWGGGYRSGGWGGGGFGGGGGGGFGGFGGGSTGGGGAGGSW